MKPFNLVRWYLVLSLAGIGIVSTVFSVLLSSFLEQRIVQQDSELMRGFIQNVVQEDLPNDFFHGKQTAHPYIQRFFSHVTTMPDVTLANVYAHDGTIRWSTDPKLVGRTVTGNRDLARALAGELQMRTGTIDEEQLREEPHLREKFHSQFVESYIPVTGPGGTEIIGVIEIYRAPEALFRTIRSGIELVWATAIAGGLFLYVMLSGVILRADRLIRSQQNRLVESETLGALAEMTAAVAHGLRTPLVSIRHLAERWRNEHAAQERSTTEELISEVNRLEDWVRDLLTYSEPQHERLGAVELAVVISRSFRHFAREAEKRRVSMNLAVNARLPCIRGDPALIGQVFNNLISNALDAMPEGGRITVNSCIAQTGSQISVSIADTGTGIAADRIHLVGQPFYTTKADGLGAGLALARRIISRLGGSMDIESREGHGTTVTLAFPIAR